MKQSPGLRFAEVLKKTPVHATGTAFLKRDLRLGAKYGALDVSILGQTGSRAVILDLNRHHIALSGGVSGVNTSLCIQDILIQNGKVIRP